MSAFFRKPGFLNRTSASALMAAAEADVMDRPVAIQGQDMSVDLDEHAPNTPGRNGDTTQSPLPSTFAFIITRLEDDKLYSTKELAKVLGFLSHRSLERYRCTTGRGGGPAYTRSGAGMFAKGKIVYLGLDVKTWLRAGYVTTWHDPEAADRERERRRKREAKNNR